MTKKQQKAINNSKRTIGGLWNTVIIPNKKKRRDRNKNWRNYQDRY